MEALKKGCHHTKNVNKNWKKLIQTYYDGMTTGHLFFLIIACLSIIMVEFTKFMKRFCMIVMKLEAIFKCMTIGDSLQNCRAIAPHTLNKIR